jgi:hypothetical protein
MKMTVNVTAHGGELLSKLDIDLCRMEYPISVEDRDMIQRALTACAEGLLAREKKAQNYVGRVFYDPEEDEFFKVIRVNVRTGSLETGSARTYREARALTKDDGSGVGIDQLEEGIGSRYWVFPQDNNEIGHRLSLELPYGLSVPDLVLDSEHDRGADMDVELEWLRENAGEEELPRILTSAVLLFHAKAGTIGECLRTAVVWERG